jgi:YesN/AraC family two-component response regulator
MKNKNVFTLVNQQDGNLAFKLFTFSDNSYFDHIQRNSFYTVIWVTEGEGLLKVDFSEYTFSKNSFFAFAPYQPFMLSTENIKGIAIHFHSDFYCIHQSPNDTSCDVILFNNIYQKPFFYVDEQSEEKFIFLIEQIKSELKENENYELLIPNLKVFLGNATRAKEKVIQQVNKVVDSKTPFILKSLKKEIETNFKVKHKASDYADLLNISSNALAKLVKNHYDKTLTDLITDRIIIEAKRELYLTNKTIKEISWSLGYKDEYYFSRLFKKKTDISPNVYRRNVGFGKAELN